MCEIASANRRAGLVLTVEPEYRWHDANHGPGTPWPAVMLRTDDPTADKFRIQIAPPAD